MKLFGLGKGKKESLTKKSPLDIIDENEITGNLFYLQFNFKSLKINVVGKDTEYSCKVSEVDHDKGVFYLTVLGRANISKSDEVEMHYDITEIQYHLKTIIKKNDSEYDLCLEYPKIIRHFERRKNPRALFRRSEDVEIKLVTDLFSGYGGVGRLSNIGVGGFSCLISKVVNVSTGQNVTISPLTFKPSTQFGLIKFLLPGFGDMELSAGETIHTKQVGYNLNCGIALGKLNTAQHGILEKFATNRASTPMPPDYFAFFKKYEEKKEGRTEEKSDTEEEKTVEIDSNETGYTKAPEQTTAPETKELPVEKEEKVAAEEPPVEKKAPARNESILLILFNGDEINLVKKVLENKGFSNKTIVNGYAEALKIMTEKKFDLILLDYDLNGQVTAEQFIRTLKKHPTLKELPIAIILDNIDAGKQAKIISLRVSRMTLRPIKESDISETLEKTLGN
jgi:CheY-like chemotaxis protein